MNKIIALIFISIFFISLTSASIENLGYFRLNNNIELKQLCSNCTYINITSILYPNSSQALGNVPMTKIGTVYNYTLQSTLIRKSGTWIVNGVGDLNGINTVWSYTFIVNPNGEELTIGLSIMNLIGLLIISGLFGLFLFWGIRLPWKNESDNEEGFLVKVEWKKYLKLFCIVFTYVTLMAFLYMSWNITAAYITLENISKFILVLYSIMRALFIPLFVLTIILGGIKFFKDAKLFDQIKKGYNVYEK